MTGKKLLLLPERLCVHFIVLSENPPTPCVTITVAAPKTWY